MLKRSQPLEQLELFQPPRIRPAWRTLPTDVRQTVTRLLARILHDHHARPLRKQKSRGGPTND